MKPPRTIQIIISILFCLCEFTYGQIKKPILMVKPSEPWCEERGYIKNGRADYRKALHQDSELFSVVSKIGELMSKYGFPLKDMSQSLIEGDSLLSKVKTDIMLEVGWQQNRIGPKKSITYNLRAIDNYTGKQIAAASGTGKPSIACETMVLLEEAVLEHMDAFQDQLTKYFEDLIENGREATMNVSISEEASDKLSFNISINGETLADIIDEWFEEHSVGHRYQVETATGEKMTFVQVRIPVVDENGNASDARKFIAKLRKYLLNKNIKSNVICDGLGKAALTITSLSE